MQKAGPAPQYGAIEVIDKNELLGELRAENHRLREALRLALAALEIMERGDTPNVAAIATRVARKAAEGLVL
jgi:hypothetical protein